MDELPEKFNTNYWSLEEFDKRQKEYEEELKAKGIKRFWVQDFYRNEYYRFDVLNDTDLQVFKSQKQPEVKVALKSLKDISDKIDNALSDSENTHRFISFSEIEQGTVGDVQTLKYIFQDWINDELKRVEFFKQINMPEPEKKFWLH